MGGVIFLFFVFVIGLLFGLIFFPRLPLIFLVFSSFLWGAVIISSGVLFIRLLRLPLIGNQYFVLLFILLTVPISVLVFITKPKFKFSDCLLIFISALSFFLINLFFHIFNFSLATIDSFALILLGRVISFEGLNPYVLNSFTSWGPLIPTLHSLSIFLGVEYLAGLAVNFGLSTVCLFGYVCFTFCQQILNNTGKAMLITILSIIVFITTPMFIIQSFYIHTNLPAACYFLLSISIAWFFINDGEAYWLILLPFSLVGLSFSRSETFVYSVPLLILLFVSVKNTSKAMLVSSSLFIVGIFAWLVFLYLNIPSGTDILDKNRIFLLLLGLILFLVFLLSLRNSIISNFIKPLISRFFLFPFIALLIIMFLVKPLHMLECNLSIIQNLFLTGEWGVVFWIWILLLMAYFVIPQPEINIFLNKLTLSTMLIISCLGFFRIPYRLAWNDSANRLMTLVYPLILLLLAINLASLIRQKQLHPEEELNSVSQDS